MKYSLIACGLLLGSLLHAQEPSGGNRICGDRFAGTGLYGLSYREALKKTASLFTSYQDFLFGKLVAEPPDFGDIRSLTKRAQELSEHFFMEQGFEPDGRMHPFGIGEPALLQWPYPYSGYPSEEAREVLHKLAASLYRYRPESHIRSLKELLELQEQALLLKEEKDVFISGVPVSMALAACMYWYQQGDKWMLLLARPGLVLQEKYIAGSTESVSSTNCRSSTWHLTAAAATGAARVLTAEDIPDTAAAWQQALLGGSAASAGNFFNQVIHCSIDWWPY